MRGPVARQICRNPNCKRSYVAGHYGKIQVVCDGGADVSCPKCKGAGKKNGQSCPKCAGKGKVRQTCQEWYKVFWSQTRRPPRGMPDADFQKALKEIGADKFFRTLMVCARYSALRKGELLGLTWSDAFEVDGTPRPIMEVRGQWDDAREFVPLKTGQGRFAFFTHEAVEELASYWKWARKNGIETEPDARVFQISESAVWKRFTSVERRLGIKNRQTGRPYRWHDLRHTRVSELVQAGKLQLAQKAAGHKSLNTTMIYAERPPEELLQEMEDAMKGKGKR